MKIWNNTDIVFKRLWNLKHYSNPNNNPVNKKLDNFFFGSKISSSSPFIPSFQFIGMEDTKTLEIAFVI
jgi:hypothetical protein